MRIQRSMLGIIVPLVCGFLPNLPLRAQVICPVTLGESIRYMREEAGKEGRSAGTALTGPIIVSRIWPHLCYLVETVRLGEGNPPEVKALLKLAEQPRPFTAEQQKEFDTLVTSINGQFIQTSEGALMELSDALQALVAFERRWVMRLVGPLLEEKARIAPEFDSPKPTVQLHALDAAMALSAKGILPKETKQLQTLEQWQTWWAKHKKEYGPVLKLPPENKAAAK